MVHRASASDGPIRLLIIDVTDVPECSDTPRSPRSTCVAQMPDNIENYNALKDRGYDTIAVAMQYDPPNYVKNFAESRELPFKVVIDATGEIAREFGDVRLTPTAFLIDKQGNIIRRYLGNYDKEAFLATVNKALG